MRGRNAEAYAKRGWCEARDQLLNRRMRRTRHPSEDCPSAVCWTAADERTEGRKDAKGDAFVTDGMTTECSTETHTQAHARDIRAKAGQLVRPVVVRARHQLLRLE
jgi:hypothetical protein